MHRARRTPQRVLDRPRGQALRMAKGVRPRFGDRHLGRPARMATVEPRLLDRLARAEIPQLARPVGGQHHAAAVLD